MRDAKRNRRKLNAAQQWRPQLIQVQINPVSASLIKLYPDSSDPLSQGARFVAGQDIGTGLEVTNNGTPVTPSSVTITDNRTRISFAFSPALDTGDVSVKIPAWNASVRSDGGGWLAPSFVHATLV